MNDIVTFFYSLINLIECMVYGKEHVVNVYENNIYLLLV